MGYFTVAVISSWPRFVRLAQSMQATVKLSQQSFLVADIKFIWVNPEAPDVTERVRGLDFHGLISLAPASEELLSVLRYRVERGQVRL